MSWTAFEIEPRVSFLATAILSFDETTAVVVGEGPNPTIGPLPNIGSFPYAGWWDGSDWTITGLPMPILPPATLSYLTDAWVRAIHGVDRSDIWAVGEVTYSDGTSTDIKTLTWHWDGNGWTVQLGFDTFEAFFGTSASSRSDGLAVGFVFRRSPTPTRAWADSWDGTRWSHTQIPDTDLMPHYTMLHAVAHSGEDDAWAVGDSYSPIHGYSPIALHWDQFGWHEERVDQAGLGNGTLWAVTAIAADDIWAVGSQGPTAGARALIVHFNGDRWYEVGAPISTANVVLRGVAAMSSTDAVAVGAATPAGSAKSHYLILRWDGTSWAQEPVPVVTQAHHGLSCIDYANGRYRAAGYVVEPLGDQLLDVTSA